MYKIFSPVPAVGYWANHFAFRDALAAGKTEFGTAKTVAAMEAVVRNTFVQGVLSVIFVTLAIVVIVMAVIVTIKALRNGGGADLEDAPVASRRFAPAGFLATKAEREIEKEWEALPADHPARPTRRRTTERSSWLCHTRNPVRPSLASGCASRGSGVASGGTSRHSWATVPTTCTSRTTGCTTRGRSP
jgi:hypothetical protein